MLYRAAHDRGNVQNTAKSPNPILLKNWGTRTPKESQKITLAHIHTILIFFLCK